MSSAIIIDTKGILNFLDPSGSKISTAFIRKIPYDIDAMYVKQIDAIW